MFLILMFVQAAGSCCRTKRRFEGNYGGTSYQDPANQDPLSQNSENTALRNLTVC